jgi:hypothetical protein
MTLPVSIRVNVRAPFPTQVKGAAFIGVAKANGVWTITPNYFSLGQNVVVKPTQALVLQDPLTGAFSWIGAAAFVSAALSPYRIITTVGAASVLATDVVLLFEKATSGASTVNLPASATRVGAPVTIKDLTGDANTNNITIVPAAGETIDGFSAAAAAANGTAVVNVNFGAIQLYPLTSGGWYVLARP